MLSEWAQHAHYFAAHSLDPIVFLRLMRMVFLIPSALLMLKEPMMCGGRNRRLHYATAVLFFTLAYQAWNLAQQRMILLVEPGIIPLPAANILFGECLVATATLVVTIILGYDYYRWKELKRMNMMLEKCTHPCT